MFPLLVGDFADPNATLWEGVNGKLIATLAADAGLTYETLEIFPFAQPRDFFIGKSINPAYTRYYDTARQKIAGRPCILLGKYAAGLVNKWSIDACRGICYYDPFPHLITYSPDTILKDWSLRPIVVRDFKKFIHYHDAPYPDRTIHVVETLADLPTDVPPLFTVDVETKANQITCVGLGFSATLSYVIPIWDETSYWSEADELQVWLWLRDLLEGGPTKVLHNAMYDLQYFAAHGIKVYPIEDTMLMWHSQEPEMKKSLGFLGSLLCNAPDWKSWNPHRKKDITKKDE